MTGDERTTTPAEVRPELSSPLAARLLTPAVWSPQADVVRASLVAESFEPGERDHWTVRNSVVHATSHACKGDDPVPPSLFGVAPWATIADGPLEVSVEELFVAAGAYPCRCVGDYGLRFDPRELSANVIFSMFIDPVVQPSLDDSDLFRSWMRVRDAIEDEIFTVGWATTAQRRGDSLAVLPPFADREVRLWCHLSQLRLDIQGSDNRASSERRTLSQILRGERAPSASHIEAAAGCVWDQTPAAVFTGGADPFTTMVMRVTAAASSTLVPFEPAVVVVPRSLADLCGFESLFGSRTHVVDLGDEPTTAETLTAALTLWCDEMPADEALAVARGITAT